MSLSMRQSQKLVCIEKTTGLESNQFSREENRFNSGVNQKSNSAQHHSLGLATRNNSNIVFNFGSNLGYKNGNGKLIQREIGSLVFLLTRPKNKERSATKKNSWKE
jgi:hypothetical protein